MQLTEHSFAGALRKELVAQRDSQTQKLIQNASALTVEKVNFAAGVIQSLDATVRRIDQMTQERYQDETDGLAEVA